MSKPFFVTDGTNKIGPLSKEEVMEMLYSARISIMDHILDSRDGRMCLLLQHEDFGGDGVVNLKASANKKGIGGESSKDLTQRFGFDTLLNKVYKEREDREKLRQRIITPKNEKSPEPKIDVKLKSTPINSAPTSGVQSKSQKPPPVPTSRNGADPNENTATTTLKANNSLSYYLKIKDKEYGPLKFLILLSLLKQNKLTPEALTRIEGETTWKKLSDFLPKDLYKTINLSPIINYGILPKNQWQRKNIRVDYDEMILANNSRFSLVGKSMDLSADGIAIVWVYDVPINEIFEISLFDIEKNMVIVKAKLNRIEAVSENSGVVFYKAVFIFNEKIQIKNFIS